MVKLKVFLDSSALITAALSSRGGSFFILNSWREKFIFYINEYVFEETLNVIRKKFPDQEMESKLLILLGLARVKILPLPAKSKVLRLAKFVDAKDAPVLAGALDAGADFLITLDKAFQCSCLNNKTKSKAVSPRELIQKFA